MAKKDLKLVAKTVAYLASVGIVPVAEPNWHRAYEGKRGSVANFKKVILGEIKQMHNSCGEVVLGVYVDYTAESEAGEDLCDYSIHETRNVRLEDLRNYLENRGW